ncbi:MAG: DUF937 domain-containing protein [Actinobacteria bacterium]|nr:DUF937 domain-containing protein [Actinomycetota bacterium]
MSDNAVNQILSGIDLNALAARLGASPAAVEQAVEVAVPTLLGSLQANTTDAAGQASLLGALEQHAGDINGVDDIDAEDGRKILGHMFADDPQRVQALAGQDSGLLAKLLPILAPIVMNWLAKNLLGGGQQQTQQAGGGDILGDLLGGILGGGGTAGAGSSAGGGMGDMLGQILGGMLGGGTTPTQQQRRGDDGDLGDLLGQILGGGR